MARINITEWDEDEQRTRLVGWFETGSARAFAGRTEWDGNNMADVHVGANRGQVLYCTKAGRWVLHNWSAWQNEHDDYQFVTDERAQEWLLRNEDDEAVEELFGELAEEAGPGRGRPEIGKATSLRFPPELRARIEKAALPGEAFAATVRRLLEQATS